MTTIDIEDTVYADYAVKHPHCAKLNRVPFPLYDGLAYVFGNTRATSKGAVGPEDLDKGCPRIKVSNNGLLLGWENTETSGPRTEPNEQQHNKDDIMLKIAGLSYDQMIDATIRLGKADSMLEIFFNIKSEEARKRFIERLLLC
ncbi:hypothetical protein LINPERHAP2_LOCUS16032 [Linum perenne]